ncbi:hypothetical protein MAR_012443 [Mya arenaria]|uniref:Uncharacterized protein n=1 Tax=Mya arenaria TaxID=6604 RepID=A0ABY7G009_MYAAR|nr:hypothetical protein MAR_012443 [Mya arenaria]
MCFTWCVLRALNPVDKNSERIDKSLKGHKDLLNMNCIEYPVTLKAIDRFERQMPPSLLMSSAMKIKTSILLGLATMSITLVLTFYLQMMGKNTTSAEWSKNGHKRHYCYRFLNSFNSEESLGKHKEYCDPVLCMLTLKASHKSWIQPNPTLMSLTQNSIKSIHLAGSATISSALMMRFTKGLTSSKILSFTRSNLKMRMYLRSFLTA